MANDDSDRIDDDSIVRQFLIEVFPGLLQPRVTFAALALAVAAVGVGVFLTVVQLGLYESVLFGSVAMVLWGHAIVFLVTGAIRPLSTGLVGLSEGQWMIILAIWGLPAMAWYGLQPSG